MKIPRRTNSAPVYAFEVMVSTLLLAINGSTIFNLSDMQAKQSDADENYTN